MSQNEVNVGLDLQISHSFVLALAMSCFAASVGTFVSAFGFVSHLSAKCGAMLIYLTGCCEDSQVNMGLIHSVR